MSLGFYDTLPWWQLFWELEQISCAILRQPMKVQCDEDEWIMWCMRGAGVEIPLSQMQRSIVKRHRSGAAGTRT